MSRLNIHAFISFYNSSFLCLIFEALRHFFFFFFIWAIIRIAVTVILSRINVYCFLASMLNSIFVSLEVLSQYLATVIIRGVFRTPCQTWCNFLSKYVTVLSSIIPFWQDSEFTSYHHTVTFSNQTSLKNLGFLRKVMISDLANFFKKSRKRYIKYCCTAHSRTHINWENGWSIKYW